VPSTTGNAGHTDRAASSQNVIDLAALHRPMSRSECWPPLEVLTNVQQPRSTAQTPFRPSGSFQGFPTSCALSVPYDLGRWQRGWLPGIDPRRCRDAAEALRGRSCGSCTQSLTVTIKSRRPAAPRQGGGNNPHRHGGLPGTANDSGVRALAGDCLRTLGGLVGARRDGVKPDGPWLTRDCTDAGRSLRERVWVPRGRDQRLTPANARCSSALLATVVLRIRNRPYRQICAEEQLDAGADGIPDVYQQERHTENDRVLLASTP